MAAVTRYFALGIGVAFTLAGIGGFVPGLTTPPPPGSPHLSLETSYGYLLGLFPVNIVHNLVHLAIGIAGLAVWKSLAAARSFARVLAGVLGAFTLMGLLPGLKTTFGFLPLFGHAVWLHGLEAAAAAWLGFASGGEDAVASSAAPAA